MYLYLDIENNRLHSVLAAPVPIADGHQLIQVPDGFVYEKPHIDSTGAACVVDMTAQEILASYSYQHRRMFEYPPITDYIDGVVKGDQAQIDAYIAACKAVKDKYPKPE